MCTGIEHLGWEPGQRIEPCVTNAWIDRQGRVYYVPPCGHADTAYEMGRDSRDLEREGWIHLSLFAWGYVVLKDRFSPTSAQIDTIFALQAHAESRECMHPERNRLAHAVQVFWEIVNESEM